MNGAYVTTFCNFAHRLRDGKPIEHNCFILDPKALQAEARGEHVTNIVKEPRTQMRRGVSGKLPAKAWRYWSLNCPMYHVSSLPGDGGVDWGYDTDPAKAIVLSPHLQRRFAADCRRAGVEARFVEVAS